MRRFLGTILGALIVFFLVTVPIEAKWSDQKEMVAIPDDTSMIGDTVYFSIDSMDFSKYRSIFIGLERFAWKKAIVDLNTGGGSLFDAMGMVSIFQDQINKGKVIEIRGRGLIASAGLIILISGSPGHRMIDRHSLVMFHEMWSFKFFAVETPSDKEAEAAVFRMIQNKINRYIVDHSKITEDDLNSRIKKKEFWMDAEEAILFGFADKQF